MDASGGTSPRDASASDASSIASSGDASSDASPRDAWPHDDAGPPPLCGPTAAPCGYCGTVVCGGDAPDHCTAAEPCEYFETTALVGATTRYSDAFGSGVAVGDIHGDGHVDVVFGAPDGIRVLRGPELRLTSAFSSAVPTDVGAVVLVDFDGDGDLDLSFSRIMRRPGMELWENDGAGTFSPVVLGVEPPEVPAGLAWADFDQDGDLDVAVPNYTRGSTRLFAREAGAFVDVTEEVGLEGFGRASFQAMWFDYDLDGDVDLLVAEDKGSSFGWATQLYRNDDGRFANVTTEAGFREPVDGMGLAVGDVDGDLDLDVFVADDGRADGGHLLYVNRGDGTFVEEADRRAPGTELYFGWGVELVDLDLDGDLDLVMAVEDDWPYVGENRGGTFLPVDRVLDGFPRATQVGFVATDLNADHAPDLSFWLRPYDPNRLAHVLSNVRPNVGHALPLRLVGAGANGFAIGARVVVQAGGARSVQQLHAGQSFFSSRPPELVFGLGDAEHVDEVEVWWPDGARSVHHGPFPADERLVLVQP